MDQIRVIATDDFRMYNYDMSEIVCDVEADTILTATLSKETEEYFAKDSKGREVYVGDLNMLGELRLFGGFTLIKED